MSQRSVMMFMPFGVKVLTKPIGIVLWLVYRCNGSICWSLKLCPAYRGVL